MLLLACPSTVLAASATLGWNASSDAQTTGYRIYRGTRSRTYDWSQSVGATTTFVASGLTEDTTYYFSITAVSGAGLESPYSAEVTVLIPAAANHAPSAIAASKSTAEDVSTSLNLSGSDPDGDALRFAITQAPAHGTLSGTPPSVVYDPDPNYNGTDSFKFTVNDGALTSAAATISLSVTPVNDRPTARGTTVSILNLLQLPIGLTATDPDGDPLFYTITQQPQYGTLIGSPPLVVYIPPLLGLVGNDTFEFTANDGKLTSAPATVTVVGATSANHAPVAVARSVSLAEDSSVTIALTATDQDGNSLTYSVVSGPSHGSLSGTPPNVTYRPDANYNGSDSFTFTANDGKLTSAAAPVSITIAPVNDAPVAQSGSLSVAEDTSASVTLRATDVDGDSLTYSISKLPSNGVLSGTPPNLRYQPKANFSGSDSFQFTVNDGHSTSAPATVSISVIPSDPGPTATSRQLAVNEDSSITVTLTGTDPDGDNLSFAITQLPPNGVLTGTPPNVTYRPKSNFNGSDSFKFTVNDGETTSAAATVSITVNPVNDPPIADPSSWTFAEDQTVVLTLTGSDRDHDPLTYAIVRLPNHGTLIGSPPGISYRPDHNYNGTDSFQFTVADGTAVSAPATVSLTITPVNDAPIAQGADANRETSTVTAFSLAATDVDGDPVQYVITSQPLNGVLVGTAPDLIYESNPGTSGFDSFQYVVTDGELTSDPITVEVADPPVTSLLPGGAGSLPSADGDSSRAPDATLVTDPAAVVAPPATAPDTLVVLPAGSTSTLTPGANSVLANDPDAESRPLTVTLARQPAHGTVDLHPDGSFTYRHLGGNDTTDSFTYIASDGVAVSTETTVEVNVLRWVGFSLVGPHSQLQFTVTPGLQYHVEFNAGDPADSAGWRTLAAFVGETDGVATIMDMSLPTSPILYYRVRCVGLQGQLITDTRCRSQVELHGGDNRLRIDLDGAAVIRRARVLQISSQSATLEGAGWNPGELAGRDGFASHLLRTSRGWWPVIASAGTSVSLGAGSQAIASALHVGDLVEIDQLPTVAGLFGPAGASGGLMSSATDQLTAIAGETSAGWVVTPHVTPSDVAGYDLLNDTGVAGPLDGSTLALMPGQTVVYHRSDDSVVEAVFMGLPISVVPAP